MTISFYMQQWAAPTIAIVIVIDFTLSELFMA
jgi:hypothetical protein